MKLFAFMVYKFHNIELKTIVHGVQSHEPCNMSHAVVHQVDQYGLIMSEDLFTCHLSHYVDKRSINNRLG